MLMLAATKTEEKIIDAQRQQAADDAADAQKRLDAARRGGRGR